MCSRLLGRNVKSYFISEFNLVGRSTNRFRDWILGVHAGCDRILFGIHRNGMADSESIGECYNRRTKRCTPSPRSTVLTCVESTFSGWVIANVRAICPSPFLSSAALRRRKKTDPQHGPCSCQSWPRRHEADGGQEELDGPWVSLPSGLPGGGVTCSYRACVRAYASDFVVLVLSEAVLSATVLVLDGCSNCGDADR